MNILVIGGGGREHAICVSLKKSKRVDKLYAVPGNAGIAEIAECADISVMDFEGIYSFIQRKGDIDMCVVAPDDPLYGGLVDYLTVRGIRAFGPTRAAAVIEGSKAFSKNLMKKYGIPTAAYEVFNDLESAKAYVDKVEKFPIVVKADGLALGKGVLICQNREQALSALTSIMEDRAFGSAGSSVVIEEFMTGREVSVLVFTDGKTVCEMPSSQDHKRARDNDEGLNTGGMGTFSPSKFYTDDMRQYVSEHIIAPTIAAMNSENRRFKGVLYFGLMMTPDGIKVLEYNARFGDPETQVLLPKLKTDLVDIFDAIIDDRLSEVKVEFDDSNCVCVILASGGYPEKHEKGKPIAIGALDRDILLFHSGTARKNGTLVTNGGRVIGVVAKAATMDEARKKAYDNAEKIRFDGMQYRRDIGIKA